LTRGVRCLHCNQAFGALKEWVLAVSGGGGGGECLSGVKVVTGDERCGYDEDDEVDYTYRGDTACRSPRAGAAVAAAKPGMDASAKERCVACSRLGSLPLSASC
jgi:hypothetical protein